MLSTLVDEVMRTTIECEPFEWVFWCQRILQFDGKINLKGDQLKLRIVLLFVCVCARATSNMTLWVANNRRSTEKEMWAKLWQKIRIYDEYKLHFFSSIIFEIHTGTGSRANTWYARAKQTQSWTVGKREKRQRQRARKQNYPHINGGAYIFRAHTKLASSEQQQKWRCHRPSNDLSFNIFLSSPILF